MQFGAAAVGALEQHDRSGAGADRLAGERDGFTVPILRFPVERVPLCHAAVAKLLKNSSLPSPVDHPGCLLRRRLAIPGLGSPTGVELIAVDHGDPKVI